MVITDEIEVAQLALRQYDIGTDATLRLLNLSENATYLVEDAGTQSILRVHRQDYHRPHEIESELDWLAALRADSDVTVPAVLPTRTDGAWLPSAVNRRAEPTATPCISAWSAGPSPMKAR